MVDKLFPERLRCKKCRKALNDTVLSGLFCSYKCAVHPSPSGSVSGAPRSCKRQVGGVWDWKKRYRFEGEVPDRLRLDPATNVYRCEYCLFLHVGHSRVRAEGEETLRRTVADAKVLGSVVLRRREQLGLEKKELARQLKVPAVRITEIEAGSAIVDVKVLFKLLQRLGVVVELVGH